MPKVNMQIERTDAKKLLKHKITHRAFSINGSC